MSKLDVVSILEVYFIGNLSGYRLLKNIYRALLYTMYKNAQKKDPKNKVTSISHITNSKITNGIKKGNVTLNAFFRIIRIILGSTFDFSLFSFSMVLFPQLRLNTFIITQSPPLIQVTFRKNQPYFYNRSIFYG